MYGENGKNWYGDRPILIHDAPPLALAEAKLKETEKTLNEIAQQLSKEYSAFYYFWRPNSNH